ncbi:hypothetical protein BV22DRAFT_544887 [Leucogyrophana mollusca]|uniref:Uncharacterized protein n=1 Tax=Leucogyrophana mollusca TaxID=85980 RepID=A0ACB8BFG3_9AGAM|nr:hypothetical protein BV22DRAFT_544887 [Leucogyrophana mollusca]
MANIDKTDTGLSDLNPSNGPAIAQALNLSAEDPAINLADKPPVGNSDTVCSDQSPLSPNSISPANSAAPSRPSPASGISSPFTPLSVPHPKKFSAVNINKKFLEKNSSAGSTPVSSNLVTVKSGSPAPRPATQPSNSHSRLVTAKLTAAPPLSTTTGPGWSRPSSATPPVSSTPSTSSNVPPSHPPPPLAPAPAAPQLPHAGKVIQPQPRAAAATSATTARKNGPSRPAWGNANASASTSLAENAVPSEFPTAAEVAHGTLPSRKVKVVDAAKAEGGPPSKQVTLEEADAFRGVHLNPNAHHWDEMEEDDDNFLDGVIEFGDGRQYKISPADIPPQQPPSPSAGGASLGAGDTSLTSDGPVSKEERFADDFDRSWPRSKTSPSIPHREFPPRTTRQPSSSPASSHPSHSPSESSRVLFNERSNRLEPYSSSHPPPRHAFPAGPHPPARRGSHFDTSLSPVDSRSGRDIPPQSPVHSVQLLQKPLGNSDGPPRGRGFGNGYASGPFPKQRDSMPPPSLSMPPGQAFGRGRDPHIPPIGRDRRDSASDGRSRRLSNMGPPPLPGSLQERSKDTGRQFPPHLMQGAPPPQRRLSSREPSSRPPSVAAGESPVSLGPLGGNALVASPVLSQASIHSEVTQPLSATGLDLEDVHKTAMRKAAELEEKMKVQVEAKKPTAQEEEAIQVIEAAVSTTKLPTPETVQSKAPTSEVPGPLPPTVRPQIGRTSSLKPISRPPVSGRPSHTTPVAGPDQPSPAGQAESWRSKANPLPPPTPSRKTSLLPSTPRQVHARPTASQQQPPPMLHGVQEPITAAAGEDLEVVDFSELGKFVGSTDPLPASTPPNHSETTENGGSRPSRPVASDFFEDTPPPPKVSADGWRRKGSVELARPSMSGSALGQEEPRSSGRRRDSEATTNTSNGDSHVGSQVVIAPPLSSSQQRTPRTATSYREAPMSALDDVMSRIKGALVGMQAGDPTKDSFSLGSFDPDVSTSSIKSNPFVVASSVKAVKEPKWLPPALRPRQPNPDQQDQEVFDVTRCEPPRSPKPAWNAYVVRLPSISRPMDPMPKKQAHYAKNTMGHIRWDIMSWEPPVEGMSRRDFSLNDVLFRKAQPYKGRVKYRVSLPRTKSAHRSTTSPGAANFGPKVHLPSVASKPSAPPPRSKVVDDLLSWRKAPLPSSVSETIPEVIVEVTPSPALDTMSRSPPPELLHASPGAAPSDDAAAAKAEAALSRARSQPKMPAGSAVGFYRDPPPDLKSPEEKPAVNFTVISELEEQSPSSILFSSTSVSLSPLKSSTVGKEEAITSRVVNGLGSESPRLLVTTSVENKSADEPSDRALATPASGSYTTAWSKSPLSFSTKESPARGPDPEHLKAVWSQAADKAPLPAVNSLEGIADDLTALPFTLQDVKSEDGETPPPTSSIVSSKMSLHDVTRAFQQVPSSSSAAPHRNTPLSPSSASGPIGRPSTFSYASPLQPPNTSMRPSYPSYPSPMMAHSPSPTLMYPPAAPSPVPRMPVNGFSQPMWMSLPPPQNHNGAMRPLSSPYPAQIMSYPSPGGGPSMYTSAPPPHGMQNVPQLNGTSQPRPRGMPVMSPVMHHATPSHPNAPMYAGSPVMMHAPPMMHVPPGHQPYMSPIPSARGQARPDGGPVPPPMHHPHTNHQPSHSSPYNPVPQPPFARPSW